MKYGLKKHLKIIIWTKITRFERLWAKKFFGIVFFWLEFAPNFLARYRLLLDFFSQITGQKMRVLKKNVKKWPFSASTVPLVGTKSTVFQNTHPTREIARKVITFYRFLSAYKVYQFAIFCQKMHKKNKDYWKKLMKSTRFERLWAEKFFGMVFQWLEFAPYFLALYRLLLNLFGCFKMLFWWKFLVFFQNYCFFFQNFLFFFKIFVLQYSSSN